MKKLITLTLSLFLCIDLFAQEADLKLFPVVEGKVMYESIVDLNGFDAGTIHVRAFKWMLDNFKNREQIADDLDIGQTVYKVSMESGIYTVDFTIQVDSKDNKYRYRIYDIKHTVTSQKDNAMFAKYLVNVSADTDNSIVKGELKGYSKGQKKEAQKTIIQVDELINKVINSLHAAINKKAATF